MKKTFFLVLTFILFGTGLHAQRSIEENEESFKKHFIGSSLFMLGNFAAKNRPDFAQLNFGRRLNSKNAISLELKTWKYAWPLGIPFGTAFEAEEERYPGYIREWGVALAYQHFWWKGLYSAIHVMNARQYYFNESGEQIDKGYQMFNTYRLGYQITFANNRFFIEPSLAITHRPFQSKMPEGFESLNEKWPLYFIGEPGLHFGFNF